MPLYNFSQLDRYWVHMFDVTFQWFRSMSKEQAVLLHWTDTLPFVKDTILSSGFWGAAGDKIYSESLIFSPWGTPRLAFVEGFSSPWWTLSAVNDISSSYSDTWVRVVSTLSSYVWNVFQDLLKPLIFWWIALRICNSFWIRYTEFLDTSFLSSMIHAA